MFSINPQLMKIHENTKSIKTVASGSALVDSTTWSEPSSSQASGCDVKTRSRTRSNQEDWEEITSTSNYSSYTVATSYKQGMNSKRKMWIPVPSNRCFLVLLKLLRASKTKPSECRKRFSAMMRQMRRSSFTLNEEMAIDDPMSRWENVDHRWSSEIWVKGIFCT